VVLFFFFFFFSCLTSLSVNEQYFFFSLVRLHALSPIVSKLFSPHPGTAGNYCFPPSPYHRKPFSLSVSSLLRPSGEEVSSHSCHTRFGLCCGFVFVVFFFFFFFFFLVWVGFLWWVFFCLGGTAAFSVAPPSRSPFPSFLSPSFVSPFPP